MESPGYPESPMEQDDIPFPCKGCGEILEEGKAFELAGNRWHIECFCCSTCGTLLDSDAHLLLLGDGSLICSNCTYSCSSCGNKIEDLAILTGEQAFCAQCFRCRNCKRKIENLRYARTSQGIFCMDCHESLMQRRRKRKAAPTRKQGTPGVKLDKSLPSLPPEEMELVSHALDDQDAYAMPGGETSARTASALDAGRGHGSTSRPAAENQDNLLLPSSTYRSNRQSIVPPHAEADGGEFLIPLAFDPSEEQRSRGQTNPTSGSSSPHIAYQEKGRERTDDAARWRQEERANGTSRGDRTPVTRSGSVRSSRSDLGGRKEASTFSSPSPESTKSTTTVPRDGSVATVPESMTTLPIRPSHELCRLHEANCSIDSAHSFLSSSSMQAHPKRGDSLDRRLNQSPRKDAPLSPRASSLSPSEQWSEKSTDRTAFSRSTRTGDSMWTPRSDANEHPKPPARPNSVSALQQVESYRHGDGADLSADGEHSQIIGASDGSAAQNSESFLRRVSNSVRHGRSYSDKGSRLSRDAKWPRSPVNGSAAVPDLGSASPEATGSDELTWLRNELRQERQRVFDREQKIAEMEAMLNASAEVKQVNTELNEKRSTMVVLDAQKEIAMRELSVLTEHLEAEKRGNGGSLDLGKLTNHVLREFVESIQKLKDSFTPQIEELIQKRNDAAEELTNLNRMKDKSFQEFEQLSSKNAQLAELNNQLVHQIQELYKANDGNRGANGLGIYSHGKEKSLSSIEALKAAHSDLVPVTAINMSEEAEGATIVPGPQVVSIRKGQPRKFNWKKGGQNVAKGVTKGLKGAFMSSENATTTEGSPGLPRSQTQDPSRPGFGFFGNQRNKQAGTRMPTTDSVPVLAETNPNALFGTDLEQRMEQEKSIIPGIVSRCIQEVELRGMDMEGIYRKSGASSAIQTIREGFERSPHDYDISDPDLDIHAVTSALKQYFRKLPTPLITFEVYENIIDTGEITSQSGRIETLQKSLRELPRVHQDVLEFLIFHLKRVVEREKENLMTSQNIAVVFAPTIMRPESLAREMTDVQKKNEVMKFLVDNCQEIFMGMQN
ncbi:putative Rho GTPase activator Rga [Aspergillus homomorphus CBS 101889]|uniref:Rho GTPase activator Rga n=1 Tax=Aspergillus homomorphus (strain CBS 101889) TaxID=1450537 RepID=A0A395HWA1_ASPHC|nr:Rho GTPase activator Rga [Aspergillus homomorphus CBS 101889]RAL11118.1 Rho GTPase activator Rga [Aspergillus homomorphus CBS 101889]